MDSHFYNTGRIETDLEQLEALCKLLEIKKILGLRISDFSIVQWKKPQEELPEDASYIFIKQYDDDGSLICGEAAFERGQFLPLFFGEDKPYDVSTIAGWSYFPYDSRVSLIG